MIRSPFFSLAALATALSFAPGAAAQEISIDGTGFVLSDGRPIWLNGINAAWIDWNDFGGNRFREFQTDPNNRATRGWDEEIASYAEAGINCARIWIDCDGTHVLRYDSNGFVTGTVDNFIRDVGRLLDIGQKYGVYIMPVLTSFDHAREKNWENTWQNWRALLADDAKIDSYIDNVVVPLVEAYPDHPYLFAWEICNEPEWMYAGDNEQRGTTRDRVVAFHARVAAAINQHTEKPVTTGTAGWQWMSNRESGFNGQLYSDASLQGQFDDPDARLDFYQIHYYGWMQSQGASPFDEGDTPAAFLGATPDRPVIIGECPGLSTLGGGTLKTVVQEYPAGFANGYEGVFAWSSSGHDGAGTLPEIRTATLAMRAAQPRLIEVDKPLFALHPPAATIPPAASGTLSATLAGFGPFTYQWHKNGNPLPGATAATLDLNAVAAADAGDYALAATGPTGKAVVSRPGIVRVAALKPGKLRNLSVNARSAPGADVLTAGFSTTGAPSAAVLIRGVAQKLASEWGVQGTMANPRLALFRPGEVPAGTALDWSDSASELMDRLGAFALDGGSDDAVFTGSVPPEPISVQISDETGGSGIVLAEVYDANESLTGSRLVNLSARGRAGGASGALTAGFVIDGNVPHQILVRGIGPQLGVYGVPGTMPNPTLQLVRQADGAELATNDDWWHDGATTVMDAAFGTSGAFPLVAGSRDSALLITLQPGLYTVIVTDGGGVAGIALAEVYDLGERP